MAKTLNELLLEHGKSIKDIESIYHGKDQWCRCGCGGNYFHPGDRGFTRAANTLNKPINYESARFKQFGKDSWLNITVDSAKYRGAGEAYTVYFN